MPFDLEREAHAIDDLTRAHLTRDRMTGIWRVGFLKL